MRFRAILHHAGQLLRRYLLCPLNLPRSLGVAVTLPTQLQAEHPRRQPGRRLQRRRSQRCCRCQLLRFELLTICSNRRAGRASQFQSNPLQPRIKDLDTPWQVVPGCQDRARGVPLTVG